MAFVIELEHTSPEIISLAKAKKQLQIETDFIEDDDLILDYIEAAISQAENIINSEISEKKYEIQGKSFEDVLGFNRQKITSVDSVVIVDENGDNQTVNADNYSLETVDKYENKIVFKEDYQLPEVQKYNRNAVNLKVTVGYKAGKVPKAIQKALLLMITHSYEYRSDTVKEKCTAAEIALQPYRRY